MAGLQPLIAPKTGLLGSIDAPPVITKDMRDFYAGNIAGPGDLKPLIASDPQTVKALSPINTFAPPTSPNVVENPRISSISSDPLLTRKDQLESNIYNISNPTNTPPTTLLGKIGHTFGQAGNVLGHIFAPDVMESFDGTDLGKRRLLAQDKADLNQISDLQTAEAGRQKTAADTAYETARPQIEQAKILQKLTSALAPKGIIATMNPDGTIDTQDDPDSQAYKNQRALEALHQGTAAYDAIKSENADQRYQPGTPQYTEWKQRLDNAAQANQIRLGALGLSRERLGFEEDKNYNPQPTSQERNKGDMANSAADQITDMKDIVLKHPEYFGPGFGQSQAFQKWIGSQDPDAQRFATAQTIAADHLAASFGGRSDAALSALHNALGNFRDNPAAAQAALDQITKANSVFQAAGQTHNKAGVRQPQQSATGPRIGDTKTFPNGKTGKWDGQGYVAQ